MAKQTINEDVLELYQVYYRRTHQEPVAAAILVLVDALVEFANDTLEQVDEAKGD